MKLNDNIETKEKETTVTEKATVAMPKAPKKPAVTNSIPVTEENLAKLIPEWKAKYGNIFKNTVNENEFVIWRVVKRKEYKELLDSQEQIDLLDRQEAISKLAILYPENVDEFIESMAGLATVLSEEILRLSGFEISETQSL